jgi:hypothetical protein
MSDKQHYLNLFASMQIPENLASKAADALARQDAGELPCPLEEKNSGLQDAHASWVERGMPYSRLLSRLSKHF